MLNIGICAVFHNLIISEMPAYSTEDVLCMRSYLDWLATRPKVLRLPFIYSGGDMPDSWRECLQLNCADPHAMGLFTYVVYLLAFHNVYAHVPRVL